MATQTEKRTQQEKEMAEQRAVLQAAQIEEEKRDRLETIERDRKAISDRLTLLKKEEEKIMGPPLYEVSKEIRLRRHFGFLLNVRGLMHGVGVEIGTDRADFAVSFLETWRGSTLICVDPWEPYSEMGHDREADYDMAIQRLAPFGPRARIWRRMSKEASKRVLPGKPVFVYIDGLHTRKAVTEDCRLWWRRLHGEGILAGHDWDKGKTVRYAVERFAEEVHRMIYVVRDPVKGASWYIYKNPDTLPFDFDVGGWVGRQGAS